MDGWKTHWPFSFIRAGPFGHFFGGKIALLSPLRSEKTQGISLFITHLELGPRSVDVKGGPIPRCLESPLAILLVTFFGWLKRPFKGFSRFSDLQLGDEKVTLNHLAVFS